MNRRVYSVLFSVFLLTFSACSLSSNKEESGDYNIQRTYHPNGSIHKEISLNNGKGKAGYYREYYKNGQLFHQIDYVDSLREGVAKKYYETGVLSQEIPYVHSMLHGVQKKYRRSGSLMAEIPYHEGNLCIGLKEYTTDGKLKKRYPEIVITPTDNIMKDDSFIIELSLSDGTKDDVEFYEGTLTDGKYIGGNAGKVWKMNNGVGKLEFKIVRGMFIMEELHFIAKFKTVQGNYYITEASYNLAVENRF